MSLRRPLAAEPRWVGPGLFATLVVAAVLYSWNAAGNLEIFYAAGVRSMSMSWHNFFFASFDPAGTVTLDKLPGAFWVQAVFVKIFGPHPWALVAPQILEGLASIRVLFRVVRRLAGPAAGLIAAAVMTLSPAVVALDRGNISDTLMILLVLLAADAAVSASLGGGFGWVIAAGVWIGLAFQAKMIEAWVVAVAIGGVYLVSGRGAVVVRVARTALMAAVTVVVSLAWITIVSLWAKSSRPYVDGSQHDSIFSQVFVYNGFGRVDQATPNQILHQTTGIDLLGGRPAGLGRLLAGSYGLDAAWLLPLSVISLGAILWTRRHHGPRDPLIAGAVLWGVWLIALFVVFSASTTINTYYLAALAPPIAGLVGEGAVIAWESRDTLSGRYTVCVAGLVTAGYAVWLLPGSGEGLPAGLALIVAIVAGVGLIVTLAGHRLFFGVLAVASLLIPAVASVSITVKGFGPFDTPFESAGASAGARDLATIAKQVEPDVVRLELAKGTRALMATQSSAVASPFIFDTGQEVLPIGGYDGTNPSPTLAQLRKYFRSGGVHTVIQAPTVTDPRLTWIAAHCRLLVKANPNAEALEFDVYYCG